MEPPRKIDLSTSVSISVYFRGLPSDSETSLGFQASRKSNDVNAGQKNKLINKGEYGKAFFVLSSHQ
jgi:hypothetical protein